MHRFLLILFISYNILVAQKGVITGRIIEEDSQPVIGANIIITGTSFGAASDDKGRYEIRGVPYGQYTLEVSCVGYEKVSKKITIDKEVSQINFILRESAVETEQILVTASKFEQRKEDLSVSAFVIKPDLISHKNYIAFDEILRDIPGVQVNLEQVSIRGSSGYSKGVGARVLVAINGIPLYGGDNGDIVWELIPISDIERVEVIKGPASSLYGTSAIGGVINIITKEAAQIPVTYIKSYAGFYDNPSYDIWKWNDNLRTFYGTEISHSSSIGSVGYTLSLKKFDNMSYRQNDYRKNYLGYFKINKTIDANRSILLFGDYLYMDRGNFLYWKDSRNALVPKDEDNGNTVKSNRFFSGFVYNNRFSDNLNSTFKLSYYYTRFDGYGIEVTTSIANLYRAEAIFNYSTKGNFNHTGGIEISGSTVKSNIFSNTKFGGGALYFQTEYRGVKNLIATLGLRYDYIKLDTIQGKNAITPRFGLNYKITRNLILRASAGAGFRAPTPAEVFTTAGIAGGIDVEQNPDLKSETSFSFESGLIYSPSEHLNFDATFYQTDYNNFIEPNLTKTGDIKFINLTKARIQGAEILCAWAAVPSTFNFTFAYNYMWARDVEKNRPMKYRPRNTVNLQIGFTKQPFELNADFRYSSKVEEIDFELTEPPLALIKDGYKRVPVYVIDLAGGVNFVFSNIAAKLKLSVKNLLNYNYVEFIGNLAPIRNYSLSAEIYF
ncbi:MAG: TonB-dependent receptor [Melioribacter sp.]|uniref:TonB-dependent receptor n=1 Tax=Melioribacter sp. TaxID=2052167 RepID=UPI003BD51CFF